MAIESISLFVDTAYKYVQRFTCLKSFNKVIFMYSNIFGHNMMDGYI